MMCFQCFQITGWDVRLWGGWKGVIHVYVKCVEYPREGAMARYKVAIGLTSEHKK